MAIKKAYTEIMTILESNQGAKVKDIIEQVRELASAKSGGGGGKATTHVRNAAGDVVAVRCYYFGQWMDPRLVDFGQKKHSTSGLNSMCKAGMALWTKQQDTFRKAKDALLQQVISGDVAQSDLAAKMEELETARNHVADVPAEIQAFENLEDCLNNSQVNGLDVEGAAA